MSLDVLPLSTSDYIADTQHLTCQQHGAYFLILMAMWRAGGWIEDDDKKLCRICKCSSLIWNRMAPTIRALLIAEDGRLSQKRLLAEIEMALAAHEKRVAAGSMGGKAKSLKDKEVAPSNATFLLESAENRPMYKIVSKKEDKIAGRKTTNRFPQDWITPDEPALEFTRKRGWPDSKAHTEFERFRRHHIGKATKWARWDLAWHTWVDNEVRWSKQRNGGNGYGTPSAGDRARRFAEQARQLEDSAGIVGPHDHVRSH